ncbi:hypothetical protein AB3S75_010443 [Citrus x aurantiifolia]
MNSFNDSEFSGILEIFVHHARNIHNICIYDNQDVYAKFSLTYNPDETHSTQVINGGGKNPEFNEKLIIKINQLDGAVLKCEIWMLSRARNYMEDQLLGFALVPISQVVGNGKVVTQDYNLSSTDLFHSPAGTVKLSLSLNTPLTLNPPTSNINSSISSEVVLLDRSKISEAAALLDPVEYSRIEFPDIKVVRENQQMVSEYFDGTAAASFLHLGTSPPHPPPLPQLVDNDYEMTAINSPNGSNSIQNSGFLSSTTTSLSDDRNSSADSVPKKNQLGLSDANIPSSGTCPDTPTSRKESEAKDQKHKEKEEEKSNKKGLENNIIDPAAKFGHRHQVFSAPMGTINLEAEQSAMQQQIVDMYMRSMQQFTESLAKMKLPMDLDHHKPDCEDDHHGDVIQNNSNKIGLDQKKKKDGSRVFYGSRAFF